MTSTCNAVCMRLRRPGGLTNIENVNAAIRRPDPVEVLVRVRANSLNFHDLYVAKGLIPTADNRILLSDGAGEVIERGADVTELSVGDRVISVFFPTLVSSQRTASMAEVPGDGIDGLAATYVTMPATAFTHAPRHLSFAESATLPCAALTAWRALFVEGKLRPGQTILTQGSGGVSMFALQFAKMAGANVIATSSTAAKMQQLRDLGADHVLNYREDENWGRSAFDLADGGVDHVIDVGGQDTLPHAIAAARVGGHIAHIGVLGGMGAVRLDRLMSKQLTLQGMLTGTRNEQIEMVRAIEQNALKPVLDRDFPLSELGAAFAYQESGAHIGKITLSAREA